MHTWGQARLVCPCRWWSRRGASRPWTSRGRWWRKWWSQKAPGEQCGSVGSWPSKSHTSLKFRISHFPSLIKEVFLQRDGGSLKCTIPFQNNLSANPNYLLFLKIYIHFYHFNHPRLKPAAKSIKRRSNSKQIRANSILSFVIAVYDQFITWRYHLKLKLGHVTCLHKVNFVRIHFWLPCMNQK